MTRPAPAPAPAAALLREAHAAVEPYSEQELSEGASLLAGLLAAPRRDPEAVEAFAALVQAPRASAPTDDPEAGVRNRPELQEFFQARDALVAAADAADVARAVYAAEQRLRLARDRLISLSIGAEGDPGGWLWLVCGLCKRPSCGLGLWVPA